MSANTVMGIIFSLVPFRYQQKPVEDATLNDFQIRNTTPHPFKLRFVTPSPSPSPSFSPPSMTEEI
ncbi:1784_t:CDS:2 [Dentiscutata heterogama]|uniref:1784_t:CDS:1 n=1 Tax=Dentiscutata heterogama TaxID=1316150 RepID=A0ACA9KXY0_9GLOM|nr:1784_t:CDS:2 [Dentiscutata heterogama]